VKESLSSRDDAIFWKKFGRPLERFEKRFAGIFGNLQNVDSQQKWSANFQEVGRSGA